MLLFRFRIEHCCKNVHLCKNVHHDCKPLGSKYLPAVEVFPKEVGDFCESVWDICDEAR